VRSLNGRSGIESGRVHLEEAERSNAKREKKSAVRGRY